MFEGAKQIFTEQLKQIDEAGLTKHERVIGSPQGAGIEAEPGGNVLNFCANNYLGLANHEVLLAAAKKALDDYGYGLSSVRFICGTQKLHKALEGKVAQFLGTDDTILYSSCFDANGGLFETLLGRRGRRSSRTLSTTRRSSTAFVCARRRATGTRTVTWPTSSDALKATSGQTQCD